MGLSEHKQWAKENMKGMETCILPSFTPDLSALDEEGIRWDVRQAINNGFFSALVTGGMGTTREEAARMQQIATDEAQGKIMISSGLGIGRLNDNLQVIKHAEEVGCSHFMLVYMNLFPETEDDIYDFTKSLCDATKLPIYVYSTQALGLDKFHPCGLSPTVLDRIADIDNVVGLKIGSGDYTYICECFERCGDRLQVNIAAVDTAPLYHQAYGQQWIGAAVYELYQSPEKPYLVEAFNYMFQGQMDKVLEIYNTLRPILNMFLQQMMPCIMIGSYHWLFLKYYQWLTGSNGGMLRPPTMKLSHYQMEQAKNAIRAIGITPQQPDEEFLIGRVNSGKS